MRTVDADAAIDTLRRQGVHTLLVQFTDVHGVAKGKWLPLERLPEALSHGAGFAGPSIAGTGLPRTGPRSEFYARGDAATLRPLTWRRASHGSSATASSMASPSTPARARPCAAPWPRWPSGAGGCAWA